MGLLAVSNFLAILALLAATTTALVVVLRLASGRSTTARTWLETIRAALGPYALWLAWLVAATSMAGSLYFSEVADLVPCALCWYQRIAMYPLAVVLLVAAVRSDLGVRAYASALAAIGAGIAAYHVLLQRIPGLPSGACSLEVPCSAIELERFGFVTIPLMALIGFLTILVLLWQVAGPPAEDSDA
jgi:disulfide bond formation protein DsbB